MCANDAEAAGLIVRRGAPHLVVVLRNDIDAISLALALRRPGNAFATEHTPLLARQNREDRLLQALGGAKPGERDLRGMNAFGGLIRADSVEGLLQRWPALGLDTPASCTCELSLNLRTVFPLAALVETIEIPAPMWR